MIRCYSIMYSEPLLYLNTPLICICPWRLAKCSNFVHICLVFVMGECIWQLRPLAEPNYFLSGGQTETGVHSLVKGWGWHQPMSSFIYLFFYCQRKDQRRRILSQDHLIMCKSLNLVVFMTVFGALTINYDVSVFLWHEFDDKWELSHGSVLCVTLWLTVLFLDACNAE